MLHARTRVLVAVASAALALTVPAAARAADPPLAQQLANVPIEVSPEQFRTNLLVSADFARLSRADGTTDLVLERVLQRLYAGNPGLAAADAAARIQALRTAAAPQEPSSTAWAQAGGDGRILAVLAALKQAAPAGPTETAVAQLARTALRETADTAGVRSAEGRFAAAAAAPDTLRMNGSFNPAAVLESSAALAARSAAFAQARDMLWRAASGVSLRWSTAELLARTPALADNPGVQRIAGLRDVDGALRVNAGAIIGDPRAPGANTLEHVFDDMEAEQADAVADAVERANGTPLDAARLQARQARTEAWTAAAVLETQSLEAPQALTFATDATTAVQVMGGLADAFHDFNAGEASSVVLSGNIAGAALTLLPVALDLFGISSGPDPNEVILEQIHALSQQMADFQNQVNTRFDRIDEAIDGLFTGVADLGDRIDAVSGTLSQVRDQISDIYDGVVRLQASVQQLQANIYDALRKLTLAEQQEKIDGALGYETRNGVPMPTEKFNDAATAFNTFGGAAAFLTPAVDDDTDQYTGREPGAQLASGLAVNIDYLDQLPKRKGWLGSTLSGVTSSNPLIQLPNPDDWALGARSYAQLMLENPGAVTSTYLGRLGEFGADGGRLRQAIARIGRADTATGTHSALFDNLLCEYRKAAGGAAAMGACGTFTTGVNGRLAALQDDFLGRQTGYDGAGKVTPSLPPYKANGQALDLWQVLDPPSSDWQNLVGTGTFSRSMWPCSTDSRDQRPRTSGPDEAVPPAGFWSFVPVKYQIAHRLGLGRLVPCYVINNFQVSLIAKFQPADPQRDSMYTVAERTAPLRGRSLPFDLCWNHACGGDRPIRDDFGAAATTSIYDESCNPSVTNADLADNAYFCNQDHPTAIRVAQRLGELRNAFLESLLTPDRKALAPVDLQDAARRLGGAAALTTAYANLGLRGTLGDDAVLSGLINGSDPLYGGEAKIVSALNGAFWNGGCCSASDFNVASPAQVIAQKTGAQIADLEPHLRTAIDAGAESPNALVSSVLDSLSLTELAATRALPVSIAAPAAEATVTTARPTFSGTSTKDADSAILTTVRVSVYAGTDTGAAPVATAEVQPTSRAWSAQLASSLADGAYTAVAQELGRDGNTGVSDARPFTVAVPTTPPGGSGDSHGGTTTPLPASGGTGPAATPVPNVPATPVRVVTAAQLAALLRPVKGRMALALLAGRKRLTLATTVRGRLTVTVKQRRKSVVIAIGRASTGRALKLRPTRAGRALLKRLGRVQLSWTATFKPTGGGAAVSVTRSVTVRVTRR